MKKIFLLLAIPLMLFSSCKDSFFDINSNPNSATEDKMSPDLVLPNMLHRFGVMTSTSQRNYNMWMGYFARATNYGPNEDIETYNITSTFMRHEWSGLYYILKNVNTIEKQSAEAKMTAYQGAAKILKALGFAMLVDQYNDCPYTEAFGESLTPAYDDGKSIYSALIKELEEADKLLKNAKLEDNYKFATSDIMFKGHLDMWRKFGNTLRLRLLIHQTNVLDAGTLSKEIAKINANGGGFLMAGESAEVNPHYKKDSGKVSPYWGAYYKDHKGEYIDQYNRSSAYYLSLLKDNRDERYKYFLRPIQDKPKNGYEGVIFGYDVQDAYKDDHVAANTSMVAGPGIAKSVDQAQWVLPSFESLFLQAEAIQRGLMPGDAKAVYEAAVTESFRWLEVGRFINYNAREEENGNWDKDLAAILDTYLHTSENPFAIWDKNEDKLKLILMQKYIAMFGINGLEVYTDYRRNDFPDIPLSVHRGVGARKVPLRLVYPSEEYEANSDNVKDIDPQKDKIFWDK